MANNRGKEWEDCFRKEFKRVFPDSFIDRIPDQLSGYKNASKNKADFYCFVDKYFLMVECKTTAKSNTFSFDEIPQIDRMLEFNKKQHVNEKNFIQGILIWFEAKKKVLWCPLSECVRMILDGKKSINATKSISEGYNLIEVPITMKRVFPECDLKVLLYNKEEV